MGSATTRTTGGVTSPAAPGTYAKRSFAPRPAGIRTAPAHRGSTSARPRPRRAAGCTACAATAPRARFWLISPIPLLPLDRDRSLLRTQHQSGRGDGGVATGPRRRDQSDNERSESDEHDGERRHGGFGHSVDVAREERPEFSAQENAQRYADDRADDAIDGRLPRHRRGEHPSRGAQRLHYGEAPSRPAANSTGVAPMER